MERLNRLTSQQLIIAASSAVLVGGVLLSQDNRLGIVFLAFAVACGIGAFLKSKER